MIKRLILPLVIIAAGSGLAALIMSTGPELQSKPIPSTAPLVRTWQARPQNVRMTSITHGTVLPRTESELVPELDGKVVAVSPAMVSGGFFKKGDMLLKIDPLDYEVDLERARASLASAESELGNAEKSHARLSDLARKDAASESQRDDAENRLGLARAARREARAGLSRAERDIERTVILAPYDGRVRSEGVDVGQFVRRGQAIASLYATDVAEVRLPIHDEELAFLKLPLSDIQQDDIDKPAVILRAQFAGKQHLWEARVVRTEGELDPRTRMINVIAQVQSPYEQTDGRPPLAVGLFVEAEILGTEVAEVYRVPRSALQADNRVYVIDGNNRLVFREVDILRIVAENVYIRGGFSAGETICLSTLNNAIEGMAVHPVEQAAVPAS